MEGQCFICLAELPGIRRQLKLSKVILEKLNEAQLKPYSTTSSFKNETISDRADTKIRSNKQKRTEKENMEADLILADPEKSSRVLSEPEKSLTSNLKSGSNTITGNIQSDVFKNRENKRLKMKVTSASTDQKNRSDRLCNSKREIKPGNSRNLPKSANTLNAIASKIENIDETGIEKQLNSDIRISNPNTLSGSYKQDLPSGFFGQDSTNIVKIRNASNSRARKIHSDKDKLIEKKIIRSESFCFIDMEDGTGHQNKATKATIKGTALDSIAKRVPSSVKSEICSDKKKQKEIKQLTSESIKYSWKKESSSKYPGRKLERFRKDPIFSCKSGGSPNKTNNKARSEKYKEIKMKKIRSKSTQSSLVNQIIPEYRERRLEGKLKDPIFPCESGNSLSKTDNKTDTAKSDNREENEEKRIRLESRYIPFIPESRSNSLKGELESNLTNPPRKRPTESIANGSESKTKKFKRKSWSVVNVKSSSGKEVLKIVPSVRKDTAYDKSSCVRDELQKYPLSPMPSLSSNSNEDLDIQKTGSDIGARSKLTSPYNDYSSKEKICDDFCMMGDVESPDCSSLRDLRTEISESKSENDAAFSDFETSKNGKQVNLLAKINSLGPESNLIPDEQDFYSPISEASSPQASSTSLVDSTLMEQLLLKRSKLVEVIAQLEEKRSKIEETMKASFESRERVKASKKRISKDQNDMLIAKQSNKLLEKEFKEVKQKAEEIQIEITSLSDADLIKGNSYLSRLQELQGLYTRIQEIKKEIGNHKTSVLLSASVSVQGVRIAEQMKVQNLQEERSYLEVQRDAIKRRQGNLEKQLEENKMEIDKELLKQEEFCSILEKDKSVAYTAEVTSPCHPRVESLFKNEEAPSPVPQTSFTEQCLSTLSSSSSEAICSTVQMGNQKECQNINKTYSTRRAESPESQLQQPILDSRMSPSNVISESELNNLCSSVGLVKNEVISCPYVNPDAREDPMKSLTVLKLKDVKTEILFPRETKLAFKQLVSLVLHAKPEKPENILLHKDFVVSLINMDAWPELYSQVQRTNVLFQAIPYSVFIEDLEKIQASNNPLPDSSTSISPEASSENSNHLALQNTELAFSYSPQSLPEQVSSNHLSNASINVSGPNLSEIQYEYYRNKILQYIQQQNRLGSYQPNYPNDNLMFHKDSSASQNWQQNIYLSQLLNSSIDRSSCLSMKSYAQVGNPTSNLRIDQGTPNFPSRSETQPSNQHMNQKMTMSPMPDNHNLLRMKLNHLIQPTARNWHQIAFSTNLRPQYVQSHAMVQPSFLVPEPLIQNGNTDGILQGYTGVCVLCGRQAVRYCSNCHLVTHLYCSEACQYGHWDVHQHYCRRRV
ncbi:uncharacterized protein LOC136039385 [Artemia franciscana]|uniref:uncharacterized protein LOC136039385 n=1 Tax=Artemia franciscana TaxID=6661 RepID=UPI0032DA57F1